MGNDESQDHDRGTAGLSRRQLLGLGVAAAGAAATGSLLNTDSAA
ncbi:MAG: hypothetical protein QOI69_846, partial [Pseudonocardiales bacterium]|nr:hypothetical protein [Pseudonocardiales bacterium]